MIDIRPLLHPNEVLLVERLPDGSFTYTSEGTKLANDAAFLDGAPDFGHLTAFHRQYTRQRFLYNK